MCVGVIDFIDIYNYLSTKWSCRDVLVEPDNARKNEFKLWKFLFRF
jgi:hypothetical protein